MAKYDRRFLVPYLQDVCSIELLLIRLQKEEYSALENIWYYENRIKDDPKPIEVKEYPVIYAKKALMKALVFLGLFFLSWIVGFSMDVPFLVGIVIEISWLPLILLSGWNFWVAKSQYDYHGDSTYEVKVYEKKLKEWNERKPVREQNQLQVEIWKNQRNVILERIKNVQNLREQVYGVNVIPHQYRNVYAAHFLYDFFRGGQADDLEQVIAIFVLEEIKAKLDRIIEQQTDIILNQRAMMANQERMQKQIAENHREEMKQYAQLNENAERRNQYLEMINTNLVVSNYFAYNDYIRKQ